MTDPGKMNPQQKVVAIGLTREQWEYVKAALSGKIDYHKAKRDEWAYSSDNRALVAEMQAGHIAMIAALEPILQQLRQETESPSEYSY